MGKRNSSDNEIEHIAKKFKRLEGQLLRARRRKKKNQEHRLSSSSTSSSDSSSSSRSSSPSPTRARSGSRSRTAHWRDPTSTQPLPIEDVPTVEAEPSLQKQAASQAQSVSRSAASDGPSAAMMTDRGEPQPSTSAAAPEDEIIAPELDHDLMQILGEDPSQIKAHGKDIQPDLAVRLQHIASAGISKETRKELLEKYLIPANCTIIDAPALNPEVKAAVSETVLKRDKGIELKQKQQASAISSVAEALTVLMSTEPKNKTIITLLLDACKLMCDNQFRDSVTRRNFALFVLKKDLKDQLQATKVDKFLFSENLADTLKTSKAITRSGADLKSVQNKEIYTKNNKKSQKNLNWRVPPPHSHRPKGTPRMKEPVHKVQRENSSRRSSRPAPPRSRR